MAEIENYIVYNDRMRRSMWDKAFFMDKVPGTRLIVDYGCADGSLVHFLSELFPEMYLIGFDIDQNMLDLANARRRERTFFLGDMDGVRSKMQELGISGDEVTFNFSSVFHEVFHYGFDRAQLQRFVQGVNPRYLVVRDMMYHDARTDEPVSADAEKRVRSIIPEGQIRDFEREYGPISVRRHLLHLLLKYHYVENWARECRENYFSGTEEGILDVLDPGREYEKILHHRYLLPYIRWDAEENLGLDLGQDVTTHVAMILERRRSGLTHI